MILAGFVDAIAFTVLQGNFVAFMSGNTTILGLSLGTGQWGLAGLTALLIVLFFVGGAVGAAYVRWAGPRAHRLLMLSIALVTLIAAVIATTVSPEAGVTLIALVGGMTSSALMHNSDVHVGLTYVTGTLVKAAHQLVEGIGTKQPWAWLKLLGFWATFGLGAILGGLAFVALGISALWIAVVLAAVACVLPSRSAVTV